MPPGADVVGIGLGGIGLLQRLRFVEVAIADAHEAGGPLVFVGGVDALEGFFHVGGIEADQRILADFGAVNGFGFDFVDGALAAFSAARARARRTVHASDSVKRVNEVLFFMIRGPQFRLAVERAKSIEKRPDGMSPASCTRC